ncbi:hypothetical protein HDU88_003893 [Geranomyces variabilis]|nr:hypothetical protein HDU88_003893 [Geranomyces variabilis]
MGCGTSHIKQQHPSDPVVIPGQTPALPIASGGVGDAKVAPVSTTNTPQADAERPSAPEHGASKPEMAMATAATNSMTATATTEKGKGKSTEVLAAGSTNQLAQQQQPVAAAENVAKSTNALAGTTTATSATKSNAALAKSSPALAASSPALAAKSNPALAAGSAASPSAAAKSNPALADAAAASSPAAGHSEVLQKAAGSDPEDVKITATQSKDGLAIAATTVVDGKEVAFAAVQEDAKTDDAK